MLCIYVVATTDIGTRAALAAAGAFARALGARILLLVPHVVPYALALEHPADPAVFSGERYRDAAVALGLEVSIRVCVCRSARAAAALLPRDAAVLIAGRTRRWCLSWRTREQALARHIECRGCRVLFAESNGGAGHVAGAVTGEFKQAARTRRRLILDRLPSRIAEYRDLQVPLPWTRASSARRSPL